MTGNDPKNNQREVLTKRAFRDDRRCKEALGTPHQVTITDANPIPPQEFYRIDISLP